MIIELINSQNYYFKFGVLSTKKGNCLSRHSLYEQIILR